jgi:hypothetical protein
MLHPPCELSPCTHENKPSKFAAERKLRCSHRRFCGDAPNKKAVATVSGSPVSYHPDHFGS